MVTRLGSRAAAAHCAAAAKLETPVTRPFPAAYAMHIAC
jgi:hypothetical protein